MADIFGSSDEEEEFEVSSHNHSHCTLKYQIEF